MKARARPIERAFQLDLESCEACGGQVRVIACIEDPLVIGKNLAHLETQRPASVSMFLGLGMAMLAGIASVYLVLLLLFRSLLQPFVILGAVRRHLARRPRS